MSLFRWSGFALIATLLLGCSSDGVVGPSGRFDHAAATFSCGPADGPAFTIYLAPDPITLLQPAGVFVRVYVPGTIAENSGTTLPISSHSNTGAWFHANPSDYEIATGGFLRIDSGSEGNTIEGEVDLRFPNAGHLHGAFRADWIPTNVACI
jgi:hypothetical protein